MSRSKKEVTLLNTMPWLALIGLAAGGLMAVCQPPSPSEEAAARKQREQEEAARRLAASDRPAEELWSTCAACHQAKGEGLVGVAPGLNNPVFLAAASDDFLRTTIAEGRPGTAMMAFKEQLSEKEITTLVGFIRRWQREPPRSLDHRARVSGDPKQGAEVYAAMCGKCHGVEGEGYAGGGSGSAIRNPAFLASASDAYLKVMIGDGRPGTPMRGFAGPDRLANLSEQEINDVIVYLRAPREN